MSKRPDAASKASAAVAGALPLDVFKALADPTRVALVAWLAAQRAGRTVSEVAGSGVCDVDLSVVSRHLATLRVAGIVEAEKQGRAVLYKLRAHALADALRRIADLLDACAASPPAPRPSKSARKE